jgi:Pyruvate/2-oxoacid:ferredoxin oxidoreductase gamma subunit
MQGIVLLGALLRVLPYRDPKRSEEELMKAVESALQKYFGKRGSAVVEANLKAVRRGFDEVATVPSSQLRAHGEAHGIAVHQR